MWITEPTDVTVHSSPARITDAAYCVVASPLHAVAGQRAGKSVSVASAVCGIEILEQLHNKCIDSEMGKYSALRFPEMHIWSVQMLVY